MTYYRLQVERLGKWVCRVPIASPVDPPHYCPTPRYDIERFDGIGEGSIWQCDCGNRWKYEGLRPTMSGNINRWSREA